MSSMTGEFRFGGHTLVFDEYGTGPRTLVLIHGLLLSRGMHAKLAEALAERGNRVLCLDLLGHGDSDRPEEMWEYSMPQFARQVVGLLDHLGLDEAVVGGTSLGANTSLELASQAPERLRGLVIEMPVLDNALLACAVGFTPLLVYLTFGAPLARAVAAGARRIPRGLHDLADMGLDSISQDPKPSASVIQGIFAGRTAPPHQERCRMETPALVIGHRRDPIHPFSDSDELVREMRDATLVRASSILELRVRPERLTGEISAFVERCWKPTRARRGKPPEQRTASA